METQNKFKSQQLLFEEGNLKLVTKECSREDLKEGQVLIKVRYAPVTRFDRERLQVKPLPEEVLGMEGCGVIEAVGPGVEEGLKGKKCCFCHSGWSQYTVSEVKNLLIFNDDVDLKKCAGALINPMTCLCLKYMLIDKGAKNFVFHGAGTNLGRMFLRIAKSKGLEGIAICKTQEEAERLKKDFDLKNVLLHDDNESFWKSYLSLLE
jgi:NADPH:quinone reductase-like Zn-dependent oxidoreductase